MLYLEEKKNQEAKRLLDLARIKLENALASATVEDVMDDCTFLLVKALFKHGRMEEEWQSSKVFNMYEIAIKRLQDIQKREKIKQDVKIEQRATKKREEASKNGEVKQTRFGKTIRKTEEESSVNSEEMCYLWGMIVSDWAMRKLSRDCLHSISLASSTTCASDRHIARMFQEAASWLDKALKKNPNNVIKHLEDDVLSLWEWAEKDIEQAVSILINAAFKCKV